MGFILNLNSILLFLILFLFFQIPATRSVAKIKEQRIPMNAFYSFVGLRKNPTMEAMIGLNLTTVKLVSFLTQMYCTFGFHFRFIMK